MMGERPLSYKEKQVRLGFNYSAQYGILLEVNKMLKTFKDSEFLRLPPDMELAEYRKRLGRMVAIIENTKIKIADRIHST